jgi:hypothetical protein
MRRIAKWWSLPAWERRAYLRLMLLLPFVWIGLRVRGFSRMRQWADGATATGGPTWLSGLSRSEVLDAAQRCATLTEVAAHNGLYRANCLHQSLALCRLLRGQRIAAELKMGVRRDRGAFGAHAWVEVHGQPIGTPAPGYTAFDNLETAP